MANDHQIAKSIINKAVLWVEDVLSESKDFKLKDLKERFKPTEEAIKIVVIDVEELTNRKTKVQSRKLVFGQKNVIQRNIKS